MVLHGRLQQVHALEAARQLDRGEQHDHRRAAADHQRIDEHAERLQQAALGRMADVRRRGRAGRGARARLIGEQATLGAVHNDRADAAAHDLTDAERLGEDAPEHRRELARVLDDNKDRDEEIARRHDRHHDIQHLDRGVLAQHDDRRDRDEHDRGVKRRHLKRVLKGGRDRVADDLADAAPAEQAGQRKQHRKHRMPALAAGLHEQFVDIICRAAPVAAVERVFFLVELRQRRLDKGGGRAEQGDHPHPEHRACAARGDRRDHADQIAHADTAGGRNDQRLQAGNALALRTVFFLCRDAHHLREQPERQEPRAHGKINARRDQDDHQQGQAERAPARQRDRNKIPPQKRIYGFKKIHHRLPGGLQHFHFPFPFSCKKFVIPCAIVYNKKQHL